MNKNSIMHFKMKTIKFICLGAVVMMFASCKKYLDINKDPNNPLQVEVSKLLPTAESS